VTATTPATDFEAVRVWVAAASGAALTAVFEQNTTFTRPTGGYLTLLPMAEVTVGRPTRLDGTDEEGAAFAVVCEVVEQTWSVQGYGANAPTWLDRIRRLWLSDLGAGATLRAAGVFPESSGSVDNLNRFIDTSFEVRRGVTLRSLAARETVITDVVTMDEIVVQTTLERDPDVVVATFSQTLPTS
jgi:hypothetical protein